MGGIRSVFGYNGSQLLQIQTVILCEFSWGANRLDNARSLYTVNAFISAQGPLFKSWYLEGALKKERRLLETLIIRDYNLDSWLKGGALIRAFTVDFICLTKFSISERSSK